MTMLRREARHFSGPEGDVDVGAGFLTLHVIYRHPSDFPDHWVVRQHHVNGPWCSVSELGILCASLVEAREQIPSGSVCLGREKNDDKAIYEVWV